jgi:hypothetical protein
VSLVSLRPHFPGSPSCELYGIFTGKILKIFFSNVFSRENDFLDHATFTNFFSDPVQEQ